MSEKIPGTESRVERLAPISYEAYMDFIVDLDYPDDEPPATDAQDFYRWATQREIRGAHDVDGQTLEQLYITNVLEKDPPMTDAEFDEYCREIGVPYQYMSETESPFLLSYRLDQQEQGEKYEAWAHEQGIQTTEGSIMLFTDEASNTIRLYTETARRGRLVADPGYRPHGIQEPDN